MNSATCSVPRLQRSCLFFTLFICHALATSHNTSASEAQPLTNCERIMALGDSITIGVNGGYRNALYDGLLQDGCGVSFVGSQQDENARNKDNRHEAYSGVSIGDLTNMSPDLVRSADPGIILLMAGTNDIAWWTNQNARQIAASHDALIDELRAAAPEAWIFVSSLPPQSSENVAPINMDRADLTRQFNEEIRRNVEARAEAGEPLRFVDVNSVLSTQDLYDGIHPTEEAHNQIAELFLAAIRDELHPASAVSTQSAPADLSESWTVLTDVQLPPGLDLPFYCDSVFLNGSDSGVGITYGIALDGASFQTHRPEGSVDDQYYVLASVSTPVNEDIIVVMNKDGAQYMLSDAGFEPWNGEADTLRGIEIQDNREPPLVLQSAALEPGATQLYFGFHDSQGLLVYCPHPMLINLLPQPLAG